MRASECWGTKLVPRSSRRSAVISRDDAGVVQEPPAAKGVYVGEFAARDAEFVLVFAREEGDEEVDIGPVACDAF